MLCSNTVEVLKMVPMKITDVALLILNIYESGLAIFNGLLVAT